MADRHLMSVGVNYAWKNYGWDFGPAPSPAGGAPWGQAAAWRATIDADLRRFKELGLFCVRWFLLGDGLSYGQGPLAPRPQGDTWRFDDPPPLHPDFVADFSDLLARVRAAGLLLLPSLVDFHLAYPGMPLPGGLVKQGRHDLFIDPSKRQRFFDRALQPLLRAAQAQADAIYAFEIMNEPEWCTKNSGTGQEYFNANKTVPADAMQAFLREGLGRINAAGLRSTVGLAAHGTLSRWPDLGATLHQFHYYGEPAVVPPHRFDPRWPAIVGEIATSGLKPWSELPPDQDVYQRLRHLEGKGYPVTLLWASGCGDRDPAVDFSPAVQAQVRRYTSGQ